MKGLEASGRFTLKRGDAGRDESPTASLRACVARGLPPLQEHVSQVG